LRALAALDFFEEKANTIFDHARTIIPVAPEYRELGCIMALGCGEICTKTESGVWGE
jgi:hypothetical protein